jgi:hypothetical protein
LGLVGERDNALLCYLAATARLLPKPVNLVVKGPSSSGKPFLVQTVPRVVGKGAFVDYTAVSPQFLARSTHDLRHRIVVLFEAHALSGDTGAYLIRYCGSSALPRRCRDAMSADPGLSPIVP